MFDWCEQYFCRDGVVEKRLANTYQPPLVKQVDLLRPVVESRRRATVRDNLRSGETIGRIEGAGK